MSEPTQTCQLCGRVQVVRQSGRGFPPDIAKKRLTKRCNADGCSCEPIYRAGVQFTSYQGMGTEGDAPLPNVTTSDRSDQ